MKTITKLSLVVLMLFSTTMLFSQALITDEETPATINGKAMLEIRSTDLTAPKGLLIPRVELAVDAGVVILPNMETEIPGGLMVYNEGNNVPRGLWYYDDVENRWILYTRSGTVFSGTIDNYGELFEDQPNGPGTQYGLANTQWTGWTSASVGNTSDQFDYDISASATVPADPVTVDYLGIDAAAAMAGYSVNLSMVVESISSGIPFLAQLWIADYDDLGNFIEAVPIEGAFVKHYFQTGGEFATLATSALIDLGPNDRVELRMKTDNASETIAVLGVNLRLAKIGEIQSTN
ncbi:MAG: hypothetical protein RQ761_07505 [Bacteroidales bacterium]|nr:hypothetical protein [Bacteroidales bacterium]